MATRGYDGISIEQRGNRWLYRVYDRRAGKRKSRTFGRTDEDAHRHREGCAAGDRWAADKRAEFQLRLDRAGPLPAAAVLTEHLAALGDARRGSRHVADVQRICGDLITRGRVSDLRAEDLLGKVERWRRLLRRRRKTVPRAPGAAAPPLAELGEAELSPVTLNRYTVLVRGLVNFALDRGYLHYDPLRSLRLAKVRDTIKPTFTVAEVRRVLTARRVTDAAWWWVALMLLTGARSSEAQRVTWEDVTPAGVILRVTKSGAERVVPLHPDLAAVLAWHPRRRRCGPFLAEARMREADAKTCGARFRAVLTAVGVAPGERTPHCCRHTLAATLAAGHASAFMIAEWLGHSDIETTRGYSREAALLRPTIAAEGWKPGALRFLVR